MRSAGRHLEIARECLASGRYLLAGGLVHGAGREAYMTAFHAALALIVFQTGKEPKTHSGTHVEFVRIARMEVQIEHAFVKFLSQTYVLKTAADYDGDEPLTPDEAEASLNKASNFLDVMSGFITSVRSASREPDKED